MTLSDKARNMRRTRKRWQQEGLKQISCLVPAHMAKAFQASALRATAVHRKQREKLRK